MSRRNHMCLNVLIAGILALGITVAVAETQDSSVKRLPRIKFGEMGGHVEKLTLVQRAAVQDMPSEVRVYKVQPLASRRDALVRLFKALPLVSDSETDATLHKLEQTPQSSRSYDCSSIGGWTVRVRSGGQFSIYNDEMLSRPFDFDNPPVVPTPEEARKVADAFLASIGPLPLDVSFTHVSVGDEIVRELSDKPGDRIVKSLLVHYSATMDGIPFDSPVSVRIGAGPAVVSMSSRLRQIIPDVMVTILSPQEAFSKLCAGECYVSEGNPIGEVTSVNLIYWLGNTADDLSYIMPVYVFGGDGIAYDKKSKPWKALVEATRPECLETQPAHR